MSKQREAFSFFRSFRDTVEYADESEQLELYKAIVDYGLDGIEPNIETFSRLGQMCWTAIKPNIRSGFARFLNGCCGGAPNGNQNARKQPKNNQETTEKQAIYNENENLNENKNVKRDDSCATKRAAFVAPSLEEAVNYFSEIKGTKADAEAFCDHFTANGWRVGGKSPMKDWKAAARSWMRRKAEYTNLKNTQNHENARKYRTA